ncbi:hypothetical protein [Microbacterium sp. CIAB417]|uniref:hypothetical protein n=1 Tax=Microbacterium sp. CIAB417 TaxID=2860287 RepID=UPI001FAE4CE0|nr:hypothetical protein [Microbacterium sp. CIAB417]
MKRRGTSAAAAALAIVLAGCAPAAEPLPTGARLHTTPDAGPRAAFVEPGPRGVTVVDGDDWTLPASALPAANSGFFSEETSEDDLVLVHSVDVTWAQLQPVESGVVDRTATGEAQGMELARLDEQLAEPGDFWMRLFASAEGWAPAWVAEDCGVTTYGPDEDGQEHLPIWDECVWGHLLNAYERLFVDEGLAADPRLRFVYVPGAFDWAEFDYDIVSDAVAAGDLDADAYLAWYSQAWPDLADLFGDHANKLVFTGEDYPWGPFGAADDLLAADAVDAGLGIRNGITEVSNFHLSEAPSYGSHVQSDGHLVVDESLPIHAGDRIVATEHECFDDCGYATTDPYYAVRQANLKALQLRMNWMYVVPDDAYLTEYAEHWDWVRLSLGQTAETSSDAWAALRDAEDTFWIDEDFPGEWDAQPWVRNLERWLVQVDETGSVAHRTDVDVHTGDVEAENGTAHEGLSTDVGGGDTGFVFSVDERFAGAVEGGAVLKVTFLDEGTGSFRVETDAGDTVAVERTGSGRWRTATIALPAGAVGAEATRLRIALDDAADDLVVRFVRLIDPSS